MQRKILQLFGLFIAVITFFIIGCKKSSSPGKTKSDLIASSTWKYSAAGVDQDGNGTIDITLPATILDPCVTDNTITFKSDKTGSIDEGPTKCDASAAQTSPFTWSLSSTDTLTLSTPILAGFGNDAKVLEITDSKFVLTRTLSVSGFPIPLPVVVILVH